VYWCYECCLEDAGGSALWTMDCYRFRWQILQSDLLPTTKNIFLMDILTASDAYPEQEFF
jgi:hypothetical protein